MQYPRVIIDTNHFQISQRNNRLDIATEQRSIQVDHGFLDELIDGLIYIRRINRKNLEEKA